MKTIIILIIGIICGIIFSKPILQAAELWDTHSIAGGMNGTDGVALKVDADGTLYIR